MAIVEVRDLWKRYGTLEAVRGVTFDVLEGEVFGFLGPNGAGKTTTMSILSTLLLPSAGSARVAGFDVEGDRGGVRRSIGMVFQDSTLDEYLSADQNLRFHAYAYRVPRAEREARIREVLDLVELKERRFDTVNDFSGGMKRRLEIARGLLHRPKVLFLDEPTLGLDPQTRRRIWDHVLDLRQRGGLTIFLTTHYMDEAEHCDRIAIIDHGRIAALDTPARLKDGVGGDVVTVRVGDPVQARAEIAARWGLTGEEGEEGIHLRVPRGGDFLPELVRSLSQPIVSVGLHRPTLDDVFLQVTGHVIREEEASPLDTLRAQAARWRRR